MEENNKNNEKVFSANEVMTLIESFNDGIKVIAEGQQSLERKMDSMESRMDRVESKLDVIDGRLNVIEGRLNVIEGRLNVIEDDVSDIKVELKNKADREMVDDHEKRLISLENSALAKAV